MASGELVLVTGGSGFVGSHVILAALARGHRVRTTVRSLKRADEVREMLKVGGASAEKIAEVEFCAADLMKDDGWTGACKDCTYVQHVASPFPAAPPKDENELIIPAREGTLRALRAAKEAGTVKRVVICSSFAAIGYGHSDDGSKRTFTEEDWTVTDGAYSVGAYQKSKTIAERAAWDYIAKEGGSMELAVVNPVGIYGPILRAKDYSTSIELVVRFMKVRIYAAHMRVRRYRRLTFPEMPSGQVPGVPQLTFGVVDVRDVADLHLRAMLHPQANGQRYLAIAGDFMSVQSVALTLKHKLGEKARKVPTRTVPNFLIRIIGYFDQTVGLIVPELGKWVALLDHQRTCSAVLTKLPLPRRPKNGTSAKAMKQLEWQPRSAEDALVATAESLEQFGLIK